MRAEERTTDMLERYGEVCTKAFAGRILHCDARTIRRMIEDGRLDAACAGKMVDVRSIARYICEPEKINERVRRERMAAKYGSEFAV